MQRYTVNALNVHHLKNVPGRRPMKKKKKVTKEIKKRGEAYWIINLNHMIQMPLIFQKKSISIRRFGIEKIGRFQ